MPNSFLTVVLDGPGQVLRAVEKVVRAGDVEENLVDRVDLGIGGEAETDLLESGADLSVLLVIAHNEDVCAGRASSPHRRSSPF